MTVTELRPRPNVRLSAHAARQNVQAAVDNLNAAMAAQWQAETAEASRKLWDDDQDRKAAAIVHKATARRNENTRTADRAFLMTLSEGLSKLATDASSGEPDMHIPSRIAGYADLAGRVLRNMGR
jgi:hypothetical protein